MCGRKAKSAPRALIKAPYHDANKQTAEENETRRKEKARNKGKHRAESGANIIWENRPRQEQSGSGESKSTHGATRLSPPNKSSLWLALRGGA